MPAKWHKYSYSAQRAERLTILSFIFLAVFIFLVFALVNKYLVTMYFIDSATMEPAISSGDCVITTPLYGYKSMDNQLFSLLIASKRGDLIVITPAYSNDTNLFLQVTNSLVSFLTFQLIRPFDHKDSWGEKPVIRRLAAFPGDSLYMENFILHIKTAGSSHFLTEFEISEQNYDITVDDLPENWSSALPFSGSFPEITLKSDEFFALCDNRKSANDSRIWGPLALDRLQGKVLFRYWPISHFGFP